MKTSTIVASALALPTVVGAKPYVTSDKLQEQVKLDNLVASSQKLQDIADENGGHRAFGSTGHNATVDFIYETLSKTGYYDVVKQPFTETYSSADGNLTVDGASVESAPLTYTPSGNATATVVLVNNLGCTGADYPTAVEGAIALISRGECQFSAKSTFAKAAGAVGAIVYNNEEGLVAGTLGSVSGDYAPIVGISKKDGEDLIAKLEVEGEIQATLFVDAVNEERVTYNVLAETKQGDHDNVLVLGGHSDSVPAGPGINDDGSGIVGILDVALGLTKFRVKNAVRFGFWSAEEFGLLGSYHYIKSVNSSDVELAKIRAYLNFDMIASPNYVYGIYDGDGDAFNLTGPAGSAAIEKDFEDFFTANGAPFVPSEFSGRSDYAGFIENGIPSGGLFTGAEDVKTSKEAELFGGEAGVAYDVNYHAVGDTIDNLNLEAFLLNTKSIANSVAKYATSFDGLAPVDVSKRGWSDMHSRALNLRRSIANAHSSGHSHSGPCGGAVSI
ncbi:Zn-dependent amino- or carboxypeptidase, M28 family [Geosmithia morbida]|uniref:Peptide hydrolase n=1 Tax=Geosmithia morbida TaxID=1094350 RepID=A0A9P5D2L0_9HYPO|nr:Zn-dependent amino- or carboxypeptidase, M28 family [Geosmithia morbida]KAF4120920.1 Zn-dependent amino- or carboxypeptidase, M28 family [Geosmithia morbida]